METTDLLIVTAIVWALLTWVVYVDAKNKKMSKLWAIAPTFGFFGLALYLVSRAHQRKKLKITSS